MILQAGRTIFGSKHQILKLIGNGGMARIRLAQEPRFAERQRAMRGLTRSRERRG